MNRTFSLACAALVAAAVSLPANAAPEKEAEAGRALIKRYADTIIGVELVATVKLKMGEREAPPREQPMQTNGTVISASGLTVTSLLAVDPQLQLEAIRASQPGNRFEITSVDYKEVKLRRADGTEVPARFVLKDADLDLAFMAPETTEPGREYAHVKLDQVADGKVLADFYVLSRAAKALQRVPTIRISEITSIVEKPRRLYLIADAASGSPVFDIDGRVLGICLQHIANSRPTGMIVLPAADIAEMARQAAAAQAQTPAPKPAAESPATDAPAPQPAAPKSN